MKTSFTKLLEEHADNLAKLNPDNRRLSEKIEAIQQNYPRIISDIYVSPIKREQ